MTLTRSDFRFRTVPDGYKLAQRVGSGWELLSTVYPTKSEAASAIATWTSTVNDNS